MKQIDRSFQLWLAKNAAREVPRQAKRKRLAAMKKRDYQRWLATNRAVQEEFAAAHQLAPPSSGELVPILLPDRICLRTNRDAVINAINELEQTVFIKQHRAMLYFDSIEYLEPAATILLLASIFRCRNLRQFRGRHSVIGNYPKDRSVLLQLAEMGFFKLLDVKVPDLDQEGSGLDPTRPFFLRFQTMTRVVGHEAAAFCDLVTIGAFQMAPQTKRQMVAALKEAMGNAHEHAYSRPTGREIPVMNNRWWIAGHLDRRRGEMMVILFDQGVGIPETLDLNLLDRLAAIVKLSSRPTDAELIEAATELYRTSTGDRGRGRGFRDMKRFIDSCDDGELRVLSNRGAYSYMKGAPHTDNWNTSICGTLIEWRVRHSTIADVGDA